MSRLFTVVILYSKDVVVDNVVVVEIFEDSVVFVGVSINAKKH